jgi:hypothetical protein
LANLKEEDHVKNLHAELCASGRMTFKWILNKKNVKTSTGFIWHQIGYSGSEDIIESSGSIKVGAYLLNI